MCFTPKIGIPDVTSPVPSRRNNMLAIMKSRKHFASFVVTALCWFIFSLASRPSGHFHWVARLLLSQLFPARTGAGAILAHTWGFALLLAKEVGSS